MYQYHVVNNQRPEFINNFLEQLTPIEDWSKVEKGTKIISSYVNSIALFDLFEEETLVSYYSGQSVMGIEYSNDQGHFNAFATSKWYLWDSELALSSLVHCEDSKGVSFLMNAIIHDDFQTMDKLLEKGASITHQDFSDINALHLAASKGNLKLCRRLIELGADPAIKDGFQRSVLHFVCDMVNEDKIINCLEYFLDLGLSIDDKDDEDITPLRLAMRMPKVVNYLINKGADINARDVGDSTIFHVACNRAYPETVELLLKKQVNPNVKDRNGFLPVSKIGNYDICEIIEKHLDLFSSESKIIFKQKRFELLVKS